MAEDEVDMKDIEGEEEEEEVVDDLTVSDIVAKYRLAADIANRALQGVLAACTAGRNVSDICALGDSLVEQQCSQFFKKKRHMQKGVAFPTCVSVNECVCHFSPLPSESVVLADGDMVKIDIGAHIDGYVAVAAHTMVVMSEAKPITGPRADVILAAYQALEVVHKLCKPGNKNSDLTAAVAKVAEAYKVNSVQGVLSHQMKRFIIDGNKVVLQREETDQKVGEFTFEMNEVYALDICMSTGEGKPREGEARTTVFKRAMDNTHLLKMKAGRYVLNEVNKRFATFPFTLRALEDEKQARMGAVMCVKHDLLHSYPVLFERTGSQVAHFKCTVTITSTGTAKITGITLPEGILQSDKSLPEDIAGILATSAKTKKKRGKKAKAAAAAAGAAAAEEEDDA